VAALTPVLTFWALRRNQTVEILGVRLRRVALREEGL